ncbi:MAG TPA: extracellular solute-binding protein, partial [Bacilli bacterium]
AAAVNVAGVIYNKQIFADNNLQIPTTWDEFLAVCEQLKTAGATPIYEALKDGWPTLLYHYSLIANLVQKDKPELIDLINSGKMDFTTNAEFRKSLELLKEVVDKGYYNKDAASANYDAQLAALATGKTAMIIQADWAIPTLLEKFPEFKSNIGMFPLPLSGDPVIAFSDPWGLYLTKNSKNLEASKGFFEYFTSDENLNAYYGQLKGMPSYTGIQTELNPGTSDLAGMMASGKAKPFYPGVLTPGINISVDLGAVGLKSKTIETILDETQKSYLKSGKDAKIAGF